MSTKITALKTTSPPRPKPPASLSKPAAELWVKFLVQHDLRDIASLTLLEVALTSLDRAQQAEKELKRTGLTFKTRSGRPLSHPATSIARDARLAYLRAMEALHLNTSAPQAPRKGGRPAFLPTDANNPIKKIGSPDAY